MKIISAEIHCEPIDKPHLEISISDTMFGSRVQLVCQLGYQLHHTSDGLDTDNTATVMCTASGQWEPPLPNCEG